MRSFRRPVSALVALFLLFASASCTGAPANPRPDTLHERITGVDVASDGSARVTFEYSQRIFRIDPVASPDAKSMVAFAGAAKAAGRPVHATIAPSGPRTKGDDGPPFVLIRLADAPDPGR